MTQYVCVLAIATRCLNQRPSLVAGRKSSVGLLYPKVIVYPNRWLTLRRLPVIIMWNALA